MSSAETPAVFLRYASQEAAAAKKIADALRAVGVAVWFDQSELVGGDVWDQMRRDPRVLLLLRETLWPEADVTLEAAK